MDIMTNSGEDETVVRARATVESQKARQNKHGGPGNGQGAGMKQSVWSTIASSDCRNAEDPKFARPFCWCKRKKNNNFSTRNEIEHSPEKPKSFRNRIDSLGKSTKAEICCSKSYQKLLKSDPVMTKKQTMCTTLHEPIRRMLNDRWPMKPLY